MNNKGSSSIGIMIFLIFLILLVIFPLAQFALEKLIVFFTIENISDALDISLYSVSMTFDFETISKNEIDIFCEKFEKKFYYILEKNFIKNLNKSNTDNQLIKEIKIKNLVFYGNDKIGEQFLNGEVIKRCLMHCEISFLYNPTMYRSIYKKNGDCEINFYRNIELPKNN